jgi:putative redox protein
MWQGGLDAAEIKTALAEFGLGEDIAAQVLVVLDTNGDGVVDEAEFTAGFAKYQETVGAGAAPAPAPTPAAGAAITADGVMAVIGAAKEDPDCLKMQYSSASKLSSGLATDVTLPGGHTFTVDEPETMPGGANKGANPLDIMCGAFGTCQEITYKMYATVMGVPLKSVSAKIEGDIDLRGLVGLADDKVGFSALRGEISIDSSATDEQLEQLKAAVDAHCPLVATLSKPCPVTTTLKTVTNEAEERLASDICTAEGITAVIGAAKEDETALVSKCGAPHRRHHLPHPPRRGVS